MPLYEYRCQECGEVIEILQRIDEPPPKDCSHCGGAMTKMISAPAFQFKGTGWYVTDYARGGAARNDAARNDKDKKAKEGDSAAAAASGSDAGVSETKTAKSDKPEKGDESAKTGSASAA